MLPDLGLACRQTRRAPAKILVSLLPAMNSWEEAFATGSAFQSSVPGFVT